MNTLIFQTLSDPTRLRILDAMRGGEHAVGELVEKVDIKQSGVSRHLRILQEAGLVQMRPDGQRRLYSLCPTPFLELEQWLDGYRNLWQSRLDRLDLQLSKNKQESPE